MIMEIVRVELRKAAPLYMLTASVLVVFTLLSPRTLTRTDPFLALLGAAHGVGLARRLFSDGASRAFMFSRAMTRQRLFLTRWGLGMALQALTLLTIAACLAFGLREWVQVSLFRSHYYPMVKWFELNGLWPIGLLSLIAFQVTMFAKLRGQLLMPSDTPSRFATVIRPLRRVSVIAVGVAAVAVCLAVPMFSFVRVGNGGIQPPLIASVTIPNVAQVAVLVYAVLLLLLATPACAYCYRNMEVEG